MKKIILILFILSLIFVVGCNSESNQKDNDLSICDDGSTCSTENQNLQLEVDCPFGHVNEAYPGQCGRYTDTDENHICDLSE